MNAVGVRQTCASVLFGLCLGAQVVAQPLPPPPVVVTRAIKKEIAAGRVFVGTILPLRRAVVGSAVDGRVIQLAAEEGDPVTKGQPLVKLLTATIELELQAAEAELELRQQELAELENGSRPEEVEQAKAKMLAAEARMEFARGSRNRYQSLESERGVVSPDDVARVIAVAKEDAQLYYEAKAAYELAVKGPRAEKISQARAQVAMQRALIDQIKDRLNKHTVVARFDGYVIAKRTEVGQWVKMGDQVMEVASLKEVEIQAYVGEEHVAHVQLGMKVRVAVPALPKRAFFGTVSAIVPQADMRARTFPVKVRVQNVLNKDGPLLKAGMTAQVTLPIGVAQQAVMVPKDALVLGGPRPLVFAVQSGAGQRGTVKPVAVDVGVATSNLIQVKGEIRPAQLVVVEGNERLRPGQEVVIARVVEPEPAAARDAK